MQPIRNFANAAATATTVDKQAKMQAMPDADMKMVLNALKSLHPKPIETLTPQQARMQPTVADAVKVVLKNEGKSTLPQPGLSTQNLTIPSPNGGSFAARIYTPKNQKGPFPVIVYFHGGGWVLATIDTYDASARALALKTNAIVVSADYRHAPEHKFPAAHQDAFAAYQWTLANAKNFNGDASKVAVVGESAGGNLAANVSMMARDKNVQLPVYEALIYPVAGNDMNTPSYRENANAKPLNKAMMQWFFKYTLKTPANKQNPMLNLVAADLHGLPPTTVITDQIDPLRSEGMLLAARLTEAGVPTVLRNYTGVTHEFFGMGIVVSKARDAENFVSEQLKNAFTK